ncbi:MAG: hypothetical protein J2P28_16435 [Actinobacteria bacterium]|nr:hypothetical protein [Actinomycetota bacterium]
MDRSRDLIALVLAAGIAVALAATLIIIALHPSGQFAELEAILTTLAGAAVGAVGTYLGTTTNRPAAPAAEQNTRAGAAPADQPTPTPHSSSGTGRERS